jgi:hypothetical protein
MDGAAGMLFGPERAREMWDQKTDSIVEILQGYAGVWRQKTDQFYLRQKMPNWLGNATHASAGWYQVRMPLYTHWHVEWGRSLSVADRTGRSATKALLKRLHPELAKLPFAKEMRPDGQPYTRWDRARALAKKVKRRLHGQGSKNLGANPTLTELLKSPDVTSDLEALASVSGLGISASGMAAVRQKPEQYVRELGFLISVAWANAALNKLRPMVMKSQLAIA